MKKNLTFLEKNVSLSLLQSKDISQNFTDCISIEIGKNASFLVLIGFNFKLDKFQLILIALLIPEDTDILTEFYNF